MKEPEINRAERAIDLIIEELEYLDGSPCPRCGNPLQLDPEETPDA